MDLLAESTIIVVLIQIIILLGSVIVHEVAHGYAANYLGDPTARLQGRLTLNPIPHLDPVGSLLIPGLLIITGTPFVFGWAKPVPFNPYNLRNPRSGEAIIAAAGPAVNIAIAGIAGIVFRLVGGEGILGAFLILTVIINLVLAIFNLVPIPPLDGSKLMFAAFPQVFHHNFRATLEGMGFFLVVIFIAFFASSVIWPIVSSLAGVFLGITV